MINNNEIEKNFLDKKEIGLYLHIPFCEKKCDYCDFLSGPASEQTKKDYVKAILAEINSYKGLAKQYVVKTIFIGGGTPSAIEASQMASIMEAIQAVFTIYGINDSADQYKSLSTDRLAEITIEVNPGVLTREKLETYKSIGINRLSMGLQSTNNDELKILGRIHTYEQFVDNYKLAREVGFTNINIDLMSAIPNQTLDKWMTTLERVVALNPEHISAYSLIIEEGTPFHERYGRENQVYQGTIIPSEDVDREIYTKTKQYLHDHGYERYEISNYAKKGYECKHNASYWTRTNYLGIGLGSSSLMENKRFRNEPNMRKYIGNSSNYDLIRKDIELLEEKQQMEEFMFLGLRMCEGISKSDFKNYFKLDIETIYGNIIDKLVSEKLLMVEADKIYLTEKGLDLSNYVMSEFLLD